MNILKFFLHFKEMDQRTRPFFNLRLAFGEALEFIQSPSSDEFGDLLRARLATLNMSSNLNNNLENK